MTIRDLTTKDDFHLVGPGVNKKTGVAFKGTVAWSVTLNELRHEVDDLLISCPLEAGEGGDIVGLATESVAEDPLRERRSCC